MKQTETATWLIPIPIPIPIPIHHHIHIHIQFNPMTWNNSLKHAYPQVNALKPQHALPTTIPEFYSQILYRLLTPELKLIIRSFIGISDTPIVP
jgi:hypothetical protein